MGQSPRQAAPTEGKDVTESCGRGKFLRRMPALLIFFLPFNRQCFILDSSQRPVKQDVFSLNRRLSEWDVTVSGVQQHLPCWTGEALSGEDMMLSRYSYLIRVNKAWQSGISLK